MNTDSRQTIHRSSAAIIDEALCIGCTLCLQACPYDAIIGAAQCMHTVIADACTGCELCLPPCPVDCIQMVPAPPFTVAAAARVREREQQRSVRMAQAAKKRVKEVDPKVDPQTLERALARAHARLSSRRSLKPTLK